MGVGVKGLNVRCVRSAMLDRAAEPCYVLFPLVFGPWNPLIYFLFFFYVFAVFVFFSFPPLQLASFGLPFGLADVRFLTCMIFLFFFLYSSECRPVSARRSSHAMATN